MDEIELIEKLKSKDEFAFKYLIKKYKNLIANIAYKFFFNNYDTEEITQEVFIDIFRSIHKFNSKSQFKTWIYRITVSRSIDRIRKNNRKKRIKNVISIFSKEFVPLENQLSNSIDPLNNLIINEDYQKLLNKINKLPENQRIALTLTKMNGLTIAEAAAILSISEGAVDLLLYRAKKKLKEFLKS